MEILLKQLRELPKALAALPAGLRFVLMVGALAAIGVGAFSAISNAEAWQYAFTNLSAEDSTEAGAALKAAGMPFRLEAGGSALAVPASKVYDARLLLAASGLPRGGGVGFEIFDRGDLGVSEFTQRVNLRRASEGELARTIGRLAQVRSARVHLTLPEKGLFRDDDHKAAAAVVVNLQPGRTLGDRELSGIRHLVSSAVPGLAPAAVTIVDGRGTVLAAETPWGEAQAWQKKLESDLERRVVELLEQAVGPGAIIARVTAAVDASEVSSTSEQVDPDATALRSQRQVSQTQTQDSNAAGGVAGAAANQPLQPTAPASGSATRGSSTMQDEVRNFDVSKTTTTTVLRMPRLKRLSVAVLIDGVQGKPRPDAEVQRLGELAKRAVGFDPARGDVMDVTSAPFTRSEEPAAAAPPVSPPPGIDRRLLYAGGAALAVILVLAALVLGRRRAPAPGQAHAPMLTPGARVADVEAALAQAPAFATPALAGANDPAHQLRDRARELATQDPNRAAHILKAWMANDPQRSGSDA